MALTWTEIITDVPDMVADEAPIVTAINAYEAIPKANRKPSDTIALVTSILTTLGPLVDKLVAQSAN